MEPMSHVLSILGSRGSPLDGCTQAGPVNKEEDEAEGREVRENHKTVTERLTSKQNKWTKLSQHHQEK